MASPNNGDPDLDGTLKLFYNFDTRRQDFLQDLFDKYTATRLHVTNINSDLDVERGLRRDFKKRAEDAEAAIDRSRFVLVIIDGDGYVFKQEYLRADAGGARAAHDLISEVQQYCRLSGLNGNFEVMVNVYANKNGLAKTLCGAGMIDYPDQLDGFWTSFCQSHALAHFIDCGYGKERADSKIRDTYRFYAQNPSARKVMLAFCHDSGYAAELDKYRHDSVVAPKTVLVQPPLLNQMPRAYAGLPFANLKLNCFETSPIEPKPRTNSYTNQKEPDTDRSGTLAQILKASASLGPESAQSTATNKTIPALPPANVVASPTPSKVEVTKSKPKTESGNGAGTSTATGPGIPLNRHAERVDKKMNAPSQAEMRRFEGRICNLKLCNEYHLRDGCYKGSRCPYDHNEIDAQMLHTLRWKARSLPCPDGSECRTSDCYFGHHCPWENCSSSACGFRRAGLHKVTDLDIARVVPAVDY